MINALRPRRHALGLSLQQVADRVGTSKGQIDKLEKGQRRLTIDWLNRLASALECQPFELLPGLSSPSMSSPSNDFLPSAVSAESISPSGISGLPPGLPPVGGAISSEGLPTPLMIPLRGHSLASADAASQAQQVPAPPQLVFSPSAYGFRVADTSMAPELMPGDLLYVDPDRPLQPDRLVLICHQGEYFPRRLLQWQQGQVRVQRLNPQREEVWSLEVVALAGLVVGWWNG